MKTNVSIKFNSIEEYREIEKKLEGFGYKSRLDNFWFRSFGFNDKYVTIITGLNVFDVFSTTHNDEIVYNSLEEFLND